jgi:hypothetical protein
MSVISILYISRLRPEPSDARNLIYNKRKHETKKKKKKKKRKCMSAKFPELKELGCQHFVVLCSCSIQSVVLILLQIRETQNEYT